MSKNQSRIHPMPSQSDNNNNNNFAPPPPRRPPGYGRTCSIIWNCSAGMIIVLSLGLLYMLHFIKTSGPVSFNVVNASLTQFDLTTSNKNTTRLHYNLTVYINVRNINKNFIGIAYDEIEARAFYVGNRFDAVNLMHFYRHKKNRPTTLHVVFQGQALIPRLGKDSKLSDRFALQKKLRDRFNRDKRHGNCFDIQVQLDLRIRYSLGWILKHVYQDNPTVKCDARSVPLLNLSSSSINGSINSCNVNPPNIGTSTTMVGDGFLTKKCEVTYEL